MNDITKKYYKNTENALPYPITKKFVKMNITPKRAINLGCGTGRDTIYLIKNGWNVLSIDKEDIKNKIISKLNIEEIKKFRFSIQSFENISLEKVDLIVANFSIPFCNKNNFYEFWEKIIDNISSERIFCWKLFWLK